MRLLDQRSLFMFIHPVDIPKFTHLSHCTTCSLRQEKRWVGTNFFGITDHVEYVGWKQNILNINIWNISSIDNLSKTVASTVSRPSLESLSFDARRTSWTWHDSWPTQKTTPVEIHETSLDFSAWEDNFLTLVMFSEVRHGSCEGQPNIRICISLKFKKIYFRIWYFWRLRKTCTRKCWHASAKWKGSSWEDENHCQRWMLRLCFLWQQSFLLCLKSETSKQIVLRKIIWPTATFFMRFCSSPCLRRIYYRQNMVDVLQETIEAQTVVPRRPRLPGKHRRYQWFDDVPCLYIPSARPFAI